MNISGEVRLFPLNSIPQVKKGDDLGAMILAAVAEENLELLDSDILVIAQKVVSKAEGRIVDLREITPSEFALTVSREVSKDSRLVEVILGETRRIVRMDQREKGKGRLIVETEGGLVLANAGVDLSNVSGGSHASLLPLDSDRSAALIRKQMKKRTGAAVAVIISDTVGRPWREGLCDIAIGCSGIEPLSDRRGEVDAAGFPLAATEMATADQVACAAGILMDKTASIPAVVVRGISYAQSEQGAGRLNRDPAADLFR